MQTSGFNVETAWEPISREIATKVMAQLQVSETYIMRFLVIRGILKVSLQIKQTGQTPQQFWGEKYSLAKTSLKQYSFSDQDAIAFGQLNNVLNQLAQTSVVKEDVICWICKHPIGNLDDGQWGWTGGDIACLNCIEKYGEESDRESINARLKEESKDARK